MSEVSLAAGKKSYSACFAALEPLRSEMEKKISLLDRIVVKVNFVTTASPLAATPVESVQALVDLIKPFYNGEIIIAEEPTGGKASQGFKKYGYQEVFADYDQVSLVDSGSAKADKVKIAYPGGEIILPLSRLFTQAPFIVSLTRAKTHDCVVVTLAAKNLLVGGIKEGVFHNRGKIHQGKKIHWILTALAEHLWPDLAIIDGVVGMQGAGPAHGEAKESGFVLASFDTLAADSLAAFLMGFELADIGYLNLLGEAGKGELYNHTTTTILGEQPAKLKTNFTPHPSFAQQRRWRLSEQ